MDFPVSPEIFAALQQRAGVPPDRLHGTIEQNRVTAGWSYQDGILTVTILKKPGWWPDSLIFSRFRAWLNKFPPVTKPVP